MIENVFENSSSTEQKVIKELKERWVSTKEVQQMLKRNYDDTMRWLDKITPNFLLTEKKAGRIVSYKILSIDDYMRNGARKPLPLAGGTSKERVNGNL